MKKLSILLCTLCLVSSIAYAENGPMPQAAQNRPPQVDFAKPRKHPGDIFEKKLQLTEVQKLKISELRKNGHEKMKPVMEDIKAKKAEAQKIRESKLTVEAQEEKLAVIDKDLKNLEKQAAQIRKQNLKEFESILTSAQKRTLKQMKKEGRKNFKNGKRIAPPPCPHPMPNEVK